MSENRDKCIFCRICDGKDESSSNILFQDENYIVIPDIKPLSTHHLLVITRQHIKNAKELTAENIAVVDSMVELGKRVLHEVNGDSSDISTNGTCKKIFENAEVAVKHIPDGSELLLGGMGESEEDLNGPIHEPLNKCCIFEKWKTPSGCKHVDKGMLYIITVHRDYVEEMDVLDWWKCRECFYLKLSKLALKLLHLPATSASSERAFGSAEFILNEKHTCLDPKNMNNLFFLHDNIKFRMGFHWPPFHSIAHLHLHIISPASQLSLKGRLITLPNSWWFVSPEYVLNRIKETAETMNN